VQHERPWRVPISRLHQYRLCLSLRDEFSKAAIGA
jgi:hypothetical protein